MQVERNVRIPTVTGDGHRSAAPPRRAQSRSGGTPFRPISPERPRLSDEVYRQVLDAVVAGTIGPGERIVQERLADEVQVSRTPVREALLRLEREGILDRAGGGFAVRSVSIGEVRAIYQAREAIEGYGARLVAARRDPAALARIERTIEREQAIERGEVVTYFHANRRIHRQVMEEAGNPVLLQSFDGLWNRGFSLRMFAVIEHVDPGASLRSHERLLFAMRDDDPIQAGETMIAHIRDGLGLQLRALQAAEPTTS